MYSTVLYTVHTVPMKNKVCQCWGRGKARLYISIRAFPFVYRSAVSNATVRAACPPLLSLTSPLFTTGAPPDPTLVRNFPLPFWEIT